MDDYTIHECSEPGMLRMSYMGDISTPCPQCSANCEYKQMLFNKDKAFWERLFDKKTESFAHFLSLFANPLKDGISVFYNLGQFECTIGGPVRCIYCPTFCSLRCVPGTCPYNLEVVALWNQTIQRQAVLLDRLREHGITMIPVSNEDIALSMDCTQPMSKQTCDLLERCGFSNIPNDSIFFAHLKRGHLDKIHAMFVHAKNAS